MSDTIKAPSVWIDTNPPTKEEKQLFGIFISHSSSDEALVLKLESMMRSPENNLNPICDYKFLKGGDNFQEKIKQCINCYAAVVIISRKSLSSDWVSYECGFFKTLGMPVVLWDPKGILSMKKVDNDLLNTHFSQYLPAVATAEEVIEKLKKISVFSELFSNEFAGFNKSSFRQLLNDKVATVMVNISSPELDNRQELFRECKLSTLVVNFGMFYSGQGDGKHCWATRTWSDTEGFIMEDATPLVDGKCAVSGGKCTMCSSEELQHDKQECVILNHVMNNGRYFNAMEIYHDGKPLKRGRLSFYVPVHKLYGTEFKFIIDAPSNKTYQLLLKLFDDMGLNPSVSGNLNSWRIYLSLPEAPAQGLFRLNHMYSNNFLCPRSAVESDERS